MGKFLTYLLLGISLACFGYACGQQTATELVEESVSSSLASSAVSINSKQDNKSSQIKLCNGHQGKQDIRGTFTYYRPDLNVWSQRGWINFRYAQCTYPIPLGNHRGVIYIYAEEQDGTSWKPPNNSPSSMSFCITNPSVEPFQLQPLDSGRCNSDQKQIQMTPRSITGRGNKVQQIWFNQF